MTNTKRVPMAKEPSSGNRPSSTPSRAARSPLSKNNRLALRLLALPAIGVAAVLIFNGLRDRFALSECDSETAKHTLSDVLKQLKYEPLRYEPIKTVSSSKETVVCNAVLPLPDGATVIVDYSFYWQGDKANMKYSVSRKAPGSSAISPPRATAYRNRPPSASG